MTLTEGSVVERLRRDPRVQLDPQVAHAALIYDESSARVLEGIYRQYLDIARDFSLPMMTMAPTWRATPERLRLVGLAGKDVNGDAVRFLRRIREDYQPCAISVGGLMGCRGDAYRPEEALAADEAVCFHSPQAAALASAGADFLLAATMPAASEALGLARAMASTGTPYFVSFIVRPHGVLLDGTPMGDAIARIDRDVSPAPAGYLLNCVHWSALGDWARHPRLAGLQANTSRRPPEELEGLPDLETEAPGEFAHGMMDLRRRLGLRILGGCCGTDERHIRALASRVTDRVSEPRP
jgi:homocysteine S-methyltransferase